MGMWTSEQEDTFDIVLKQFSRFPLHAVLTHHPSTSLSVYSFG
jgi:hypothetical protein